MVYKLICVAAAAVVMQGGAALACPDFTLAAAERYDVTGAELYQPRSYDVVAGGTADIAACKKTVRLDEDGAGFFMDMPDFAFGVTGLGPYDLHLSVISGCDSALLINTAAGNWFYDDDSNGDLDPKIIINNPVDGRIDIWVGTYDGEYCEAQLTLETFDR